MAVSEITPQDYNALFVTFTGSIVLRFARLETALSIELRQHLESHLKARKDDRLRGFNIASAIYGGMRFKNSSVMVKRIAEQERSNS